MKAGEPRGWESGHPWGKSEAHWAKHNGCGGQKGAEGRGRSARWWLAWQWAEAVDLVRSVLCGA